MGAGTAAHALVTASEGGLVVPPEDPAALAAALLRLYHDSAQRRAYGANGRDFVTACYRPELIAKQYADCLQKVAAGGTLGNQP